MTAILSCALYAYLANPKKLKRSLLNSEVAATTRRSKDPTVLPPEGSPAVVGSEPMSPLK